MPDYRIYVLNKVGHIEQPPDIVTLENDQEVIEHATKFADGHDLEVWDGPRLVTRIGASAALPLRKG